MATVNMNFEGNRLFLSFQDGFEKTFSALWLRETSNSEDSRDPATGHKLIDGDAIPLEITLDKADLVGQELSLSFSDGHQTKYTLSELRTFAEDLFFHDLVGKKELWDASLNPLPWYSLHTLNSDPESLKAALNDMGRLGFVLIKDVKTELNGMQEVIDLLGYMRMTNNGSIEDIKAVPPEKAYDLSMTPRALEPHTDNPYRLPQPGYVLLHCMENTADGGESGLTDGFRAAEELRKINPDYFEALRTTPVNWFYHDDQAIIENTSCFIDTDYEGNVSHVRFHGRSDRVSAVDPDQLDLFYAARREFRRLITSDELELRFKLKAGEMFIVDNYRVIHSRKAFKLETGARHMRQAYIDRDVISSRQKMLNKDVLSKPWRPR